MKQPTIEDYRMALTTDADFKVSRAARRIRRHMLAVTRHSFDVPSAVHRVRVARRIYTLRFGKRITLSHGKVILFDMPIDAFVAIQIFLNSTGKWGKS